MDDVKLAETLSDHKHRIGSLEHRMDKAENLIRRNQKHVLIHPATGSGGPEARGKG